MIQVLKKRWVYHSLIWVASYIVLVVLSLMAEGTNDTVLDCFIDPLFFFTPIVPITYCSFWAKEYFFDKRRYLLYVLVAIAIVIAGAALYELLDLIDGTTGNSRTQNLINFAFLHLFVVGLQYFKRGIFNQYQIQELKAKTAITELNALKAQLNPHFLFNTLNNIYGINQIDAQKGSEMIMELSDVMRYHLEFSKEGKVKLEDEMQLLNSYIKLEKLRLRDTCEVKINFENVDENLMIAPLLFLPFVENAFKHGTHPTKDCFVDIKLETTKDKLSFCIRNSVVADRNVVKTNIGLQNTKRRLNLIFPEKHTLNITQNEQEFLVDLEVEL